MLLFFFLEGGWGFIFRFYVALINLLIDATKWYEPSNTDYFAVTPTSTKWYEPSNTDYFAVIPTSTKWYQSSYTDYFAVIPTSTKWYQ